MSISDRIRNMVGPLTVAKIAIALGCHQMTIYRWVEAGTIPFLRIGSRIKFDPPVVADWLDRRIVIDSNCNLQLATTAGTSASSPPTWNATVGGTTADGVTWTNKGTPANWKYISNVPAGDAQAYLSDGTVSDVEMYNFAPVTGTGVTAVGVNIRGWKDQTYVCTVRGNCTSSWTTADSGADLALVNGSANASDLLAIFQTDPATGAQWSGVSAVNADAFGVNGCVSGCVATTLGRAYLRRVSLCIAGSLRMRKFLKRLLCIDINKFH